MGNRATIIFRDRHEVSPAVYLHWNGYQVPELLTKWWALMDGRRGDASYGSARFVGICHEVVTGNTSMGLEAVAASCVAELDLEYHNPGDAGVFLVDTHTGLVKRHGGSQSECKAPDEWSLGAPVESVSAD